MIWIILILALILRLIKIDQSLWLDEAINVLATTQNSFWEMVTKYSIGDFHPPGYFTLLWIWTKIGGIGEIWVRLPSVVFGVFGVFGVYLLGKEMFDKRVAYLSALFMALAPLHVYYSQEARMYSLAAFSATLSFYFFWRVISKGDQGNRGDLVGYCLANILVLYSDYLVYLIFPAQLLYLIFWQRNVIKKLLIPWTVNLLVFIPWLTIFPKQLSSGTGAASALPGWADVVGGVSMKELLLIPIKTFFGRISIENKQVYGLVIGLVGLFYGVILYQGLRKLDQSTKLLICWLVIPVILAFLISFFIPVLSYFRMIFILPAFYLLLANGMNALRSRVSPWRLAIAGVCIVSAISLIAYYANPKFQREDWREAAIKVGNLSGGSFLIVFENNTVFAPFTYYSNLVYHARPGLKKIPALDEEDIADLDYKGKNNIFLFEYLVEITDPNRLLEKKIKSLDFRKIDTYNFHGVGFVHHYQYLY